MILSLRRKPKTWECFKWFIQLWLVTVANSDCPEAVVLCPFYIRETRTIWCCIRIPPKSEVTAAKEVGAVLYFRSCSASPRVFAPTAFRLGDSRQKGWESLLLLLRLLAFSLASYVRMALKFGWWWLRWVRQIWYGDVAKCCWWWCTCCCCFHRSLPLLQVVVRPRVSR